MFGHKIKIKLDEWPLSVVYDCWFTWFPTPSSFCAVWTMLNMLSVRTLIVQSHDGAQCCFWCTYITLNK